MQIVDRVVDTIGGTSDDGLDLSVRNVPYGNRYTLIIAFMEDDGRKRVENCEYSEQEIDNVRAAMLFPEGTKPKWYRTQAPNDVNAESSGDEEDEGVGNGSQPAYVCSKFYTGVMIELIDLCTFRPGQETRTLD